MNQTVHWYRFEDRQVSIIIDADREEYGSKTEVSLQIYRVDRRTELGVWLWVLGQRRWCRLDARRRFACPTIQEALTSFLARKDKQIAIYRGRIQKAEHAKYLAQWQVDHQPQVAL